MKQTINLKLNKPDLTDAADITQLNGNWDEIDKRTLETYSSYSQMGFSSPFASIDDMIAKLPHACIFECNIQDNFTEACLKDKTQFPSDWGILRVYKRYIYRADLTFNQGEGANMNNAKMFYSWYRAEASPSHVWKEVATIETTQVNLLNGWGFPYNDANYAPIAVIIGKIMHVSGLIQGGSVANNTVLFNLNRAVYHRHTKVNPQSENKYPKKIYISPSGEVKISDSEGFQTGEVYQIEFSVIIK